MTERDIMTALGGIDYDMVEDVEKKRAKKREKKSTLAFSLGVLFKGNPRRAEKGRRASGLVGVTLAAVMTFGLVMFAVLKAPDPISPPDGSFPVFFPLKNNEALTWWYDYDNTYYTGDFTKLEDHPFMKDMELRTNVTVTFVEPTSADPKNELEMLMASDDMPDMVTHNGYLPFGHDKNLNALRELGIYYELSDYMDVYMHNFCGLMEQYAFLERTITTKDGNVMYIPKLLNASGAPFVDKTEGLVLRNDILDLVDCDVPTTVAEWEAALRAFKALGVTNPLVLDFNEQGAFEQNVFLSAYEVKVGAYIDSETGKVICGAASDELYEYITLMNRWVSEGLLVTDAELTRENKLEEKTVGAWFSSADEIMVLNSSAVTEGYELVGAPDPVLNHGDKIDLREKRNFVGTEKYDSVFISQSYDSPALACRWLDVLFSDEMYKRTSYGIEGIDYIKNKDGSITFTEKITQNRNGVCYGIAQNTFLESFYRDTDVMMKYGYSGNVLDAINKWGSSTGNLSIIDCHACYTEDEIQKLYETVQGQQKVASTVKNMILSTEPLENWQTYREAANGYTEDYTAVMQSVWDRYLAM